MSSIKTISIPDNDESLWTRASEMAKRRDGNMSKFVRDLLYNEVVVKESQRNDRISRTPAAKLRLLADSLEEQAATVRRVADALEES